MVLSMCFLLVLILHTLGPGVPPWGGGSRPAAFFLRVSPLVAKSGTPLRNTMPIHPDRPEGRRRIKNGGICDTKRQGTYCTWSQVRRWRFLLDRPGEYSCGCFVSPLMGHRTLWIVRNCTFRTCDTSDETTWCYCYGHYHESDWPCKETMFHLDMQHPRFRNMHFVHRFKDYTTVDTPVEVFYYDILGNGSCLITMCPGVSDCTCCYHLMLSLCPM